MHDPSPISPPPGLRFNAGMIHALSFDLEDWFHLVGIRAVADTSRWDGLTSIVEHYTDWILHTLSERDLSATFFIVGWIADRYPGLVRQIADQGHEIASHSYWHRAVYTLNPRSFREDLRRSIDSLEQITSRKVIGFRAPSFSITPGCEWAIDALIDEGLEYDASLFPARRGQGGYPCPRGVHAFTDTPSGRPIIEMPMSVMDVMGRKLPFTGGGYFRLAPWRLIDKGFKQLEAEGRPAVVYLHPRDFAPQTPRVRMAPHRWFKCYVGLKSTKAKYFKMLDHYRFDSCASVLGLTQPNIQQPGLRVAA